MSFQCPPTSLKPASPQHTEPLWKKEKIVRLPVRWVWHYGMLHSLRERLLRERSEQANGAKRQPDDVREFNDPSDKFDHEMAMCLLTREHDPIQEIDDAILRIFKGRYGICEDSGEPIPLSRLGIVPWTRYTKRSQDLRILEGLDPFGSNLSRQPATDPAELSPKLPQPRSNQTPRRSPARRRHPLAS